MAFYTYSQNNSGGSFSGPAEYVIIEAKDADDANLRAESHGLYFDGASNQGGYFDDDDDAWTIDCPCCGDRWYRAWDSDGDDEPMIYGVPVDQVDSSWAREKALVYYLDGTEKYVVLKEKQKKLPSST